MRHFQIGDNRLGKDLLKWALAFKTDESLFPKWLTELICGHAQAVLRWGLRRAVQCCPSCFARCGCSEPTLAEVEKASLLTSVNTSHKLPKGAWDDPSCAESCAGMLYREVRRHA